MKYISNVDLGYLTVGFEKLSNSSELLVHDLLKDAVFSGVSVLMKFTRPTVMTGVKFINYCVLQDTHFEGVDLSETLFEDMNMDRVYFSNCNLTGVKFVNAFDSKHRYYKDCYISGYDNALLPQGDLTFDFQLDEFGQIRRNPSNPLNYLIHRVGVSE